MELKAAYIQSKSETFFYTAGAPLTAATYDIRIILRKANTVNSNCWPPGFLNWVGSNSIFSSWDMDSFIARITSFAAFRFGFRISFKPPFMSELVTDQHLLLDGYQVNKCNNIYLGHGVNSQQFSCHIVFPTMIFQPNSTNTISQEDHKVWLDKILLPALEDISDIHILQHCPRTCNEVMSREVACTNGENENEKISSSPL